jgi:hypothetical protein
VEGRGNPSPRYQWSYKNIEIVGATNATLVIDGVSSANVGFYSVELSNACLLAEPTTLCVRKSEDAVILVTAAPTFVEEPMATTVDPQDEFELSATLDGSPFPAVQWWKDGVPLVNAKGHRLVFKSATEAHQGQYTVVATNHLGTIESSAVWVMVNDPPVFVEHPGPLIRLLPGAQVRISATATGVPAPTFQWYFNGDAVEPTATSAVAVALDGEAGDGGSGDGGDDSGAVATATVAEATFAAASNALEGQYTVVATNSAGQATSNAGTLVVMDFPTLSEVELPGATVYAGSAATFAVAAVGDPTPTLQWMLDGVAVPNATGATYTFVATERLVGEHAVSVAATNEVGTAASEPFALTVQASTTTEASAKVVGHPDNETDDGANKSWIDVNDKEAGDESLQSTSNKTSSVAVAVGVICALFAIGGIVVGFVLQHKNRGDGRNSWAPDMSSEGDDGSVLQHMLKMQDKLQDFFLERETDGGGIHGTYTLASMVKSVPRQLSPRCLRIRKKIGSGQFGEVFSAEFTSSSRNGAAPIGVAIKSMRVEKSSESDKDQFLAEGALMAQFNHPNILRLVGISVGEGTIKLVTELAARGSLQNLLQTTDHVGVPLRMQFALECATGMQYLEHCGFIHRDLAARNVLVTETYTCKICDFGLSRQCGQNMDRLVDLAPFLFLFCVCFLFCLKMLVFVVFPAVV